MTVLLLRLSLSHTRLSPHSVMVPNWRSESPVLGCSILITSAPKSARIVPQKGAATKVAISRTRNPSSAPGAGKGLAAEAGVCGCVMVVFVKGSACDVETVFNSQRLDNRVY